MPKKTKRQKILAELRRKKLEISVNSVSVKSQIQPVSSSHKPQANPQFVYPQQKIAKPRMNINMKDYSYVNHDLIRITIFSLIAFGLQYVLYFLLRTR